jgi:hypothetical protein
MRNLYRWGIFFMILLVAFARLAERGLAGSGPAREISLADADLTMVGEEVLDWAGYFASPAGDVNGDGLDDVLVGAPLAGNKECAWGDVDPCPGIPKGEGKIYLVLGRPQGEWPSSPMNLAQADASFLGCEVYSNTGRQNYTAGDVNGDGYDDFLITGGKCGPDHRGKTYLFLGRPDIDWGAEFPVESADASFMGENEWDLVGYYTSTAGDVNADGYDDFLITGTHVSEGALENGQVYLILGRPAADWGTGYDLSLADASFLGEAEYDRLGRAATGVGDANADGYDDFLIASISSDDGGVDAGESYLFLGRAAEGDPDYDPNRPWWGMDFSVVGADASFIGEAADDESGRRVAWAGDVNGDGYSDFLIGAAGNDQVWFEAGKAYLILGRPAADWGPEYPLGDADAAFLGEAREDQAGRRVSGAGDVNNDSYDDFLIGAPHNGRGGDNAGSAYLIFGRPAADWGTDFSLKEADVVYVGKPDIGVAGYDVAWIGDFDGDAFDDFLIAAFGGRNDNNVPGDTYLLLGSDAPVALQFTPDAPEGQVGEWHRFIGEYWEPNGWPDISRAQLILGRSITDQWGLNVRYEPADNLFYLHESDGPGWLGPCAPGEETVLFNHIVQLDCRNSGVTYAGDRAIRVAWNARWMRPVSGEPVLSVYLRAVDQSGNDTEFVEFGTWTLASWTVYLPLVMK